MELKKKAGGEENYFSVEKDEFIEKEGSQLSSCLKGVTIEPMILMYALGYYMVGVTTDQMIFYKTCMDPQFNFTEGFCGNIENFSNSTEYNDVEEEVAGFMNAVSIMERFVPVFLAFYVGSWSDHWGRKPFILLCMSCKLVRAGMNCLNGIFLS